MKRMEESAFNQMVDLNRSGGVVPSSPKLAGAALPSVNDALDDDLLFTIASRSNLEPRAAEPSPLSPGELAGVIVAAALVTVALIGLAIWMHFRRKKKKNLNHSNNSGGGHGSNGHHNPVAPQVSVISMETDVQRSSAIRMNNNNGYGSTMHSNGSAGLHGDPDDEMGSFTDYGSVVDSSYPPSPAGSFRSAIDAPGFSRSRAGTGTSFATVASFGSYRSRASNTASFRTCVEEDIP